MYLEVCMFIMDFKLSIDRSSTRSSFVDRENCTRSIKRLSVFLSVLHIDQDRPTDRPFNIQIDRSKRSGHHSLFKGLIDSDLLTKLISYENSTKFSQTESKLLKFKQI